LRLGGQKFVEVDVANCQPLLLASLYDGEPEFIRYKTAVEMAKFYDLINEDRETPLDDRDMLKESVLTAIFDRIRKRQSKTAQAFAAQFPVLYQKILDAKKEQYNKLALRMQKMEADVMINDVVARIAANNFPCSPFMILC
jgi:hypothetical protein